MPIDCFVLCVVVSSSCAFFRPRNLTRGPSFRKKKGKISPGCDHPGGVVPFYFSKKKNCESPLPHLGVQTVSLGHLVNQKKQPKFSENFQKICNPKNSSFLEFQRIFRKFSENRLGISKNRQFSITSHERDDMC